MANPIYTRPPRSHFLHASKSVFLPAPHRFCLSLFPSARPSRRWVFFLKRRFLCFSAKISASRDDLSRAKRRNMNPIVAATRMTRLREPRTGNRKRPCFRYNITQSFLCRHAYICSSQSAETTLLHIMELVSFLAFNSRIVVRIGFVFVSSFSPRFL